MFCAKTDVQEDYINYIVDTEDKVGGFPNEDIKDECYGAMKVFINIHKYNLKDVQHWIEKQVFEY